MKQARFASVPNARMRILHCIPTLGGGAAARQLAYVAEEMAARGLEIHIAHLRDGANTARIARSTATLHRIGCAGNYDPRIFGALMRLVLELRPHVVQTWLPQMDILAGTAALVLGVPFVLAERSCEAAYGPGWKNRVRSTLGLRASAVVANSEGGDAYWAGQGYKGIARVIRNGIPMDEIESGAAPTPIAGLDEDSPLLVCAGRFSAEKNIPTVLAAMTSVWDRHPDLRVVIFGEGPLEREIAALCAAIDPGSRRLRLLGYTAELWAWLRRADVFVSASAFEGNPNTVLEAAASGCPMVLSDIAAHREILDRDCAWIVSADSPEPIASAICEAIANPALASGKAARARARVAAHGVAEVTSQYIDLYAGLIRAARPQLAAK